MQQADIGSGHTAARARYMEKKIHRAGDMKQPKKGKANGENAAGNQLVL